MTLRWMVALEEYSAMGGATGRRCFLKGDDLGLNKEGRGNKMWNILAPFGKKFGWSFMGIFMGGN